MAHGLQLIISFMYIKGKWMKHQKLEDNEIENLRNVNIPACCHKLKFGFHGQPIDGFDHYETGL